MLLKKRYFLKSNYQLWKSELMKYYFKNKQKSITTYFLKQINEYILIFCFFADMSLALFYLFNSKISETKVTILNIKKNFTLSCFINKKQISFCRIQCIRIQYIFVFPAQFSESVFWLIQATTTQAVVSMILKHTQCWNIRNSIRLHHCAQNLTDHFWI